MLSGENRIQTQIPTFDLIGSNKASDHVLFLTPEFSQLPVEILEPKKWKIWL